MGEKFVVRSRSGYYAGPDGNHVSGAMGASRWSPEPIKLWLFDSRAEADLCVVNLGFAGTSAWVEPYQESKANR